MATLLTQWGLDSPATTGTTAVTNPTANLPVGTLLVVGFAANTGSAPTINVTDSGGNTWTKVQMRSVAGTTDAVLAATVLTTALTTTSTVTMTSSITLTRRVVAAAAFSDAVHAPITTGTFVETSGTTVTGGSVTPVATSTVVGMTGFVSSGRVFTAAAGWTAGDKHLSTVGSGDRAVQLVWRDGAAATAYDTIGTIASTGVMVTALGLIAQGTAPPPTGSSGKPTKVWNGSTWTTGNAKVWNGTVWVPGTVKVAP